MKHIQQVIETLLDETGIAPDVKIVLTEHGWRASVVEDDMTLVCPAGEYFLSSSGHDTPELALAALDRIAENGYRMVKEQA